MCFRSSLNACRSSSVAKYLLVRAHSVIVSTTRPISCLTLRSRSGVPIWPRKYFETTMLVACCDQDLRNLDVALLEHHLAALVADERRADLPLDLVERIDAGFGEEARERQPGRRPPLALSRAASPPQQRTAAPRPFHCSRPTAGRHWRPGRQRALSSRPLRSLRGIARIATTAPRPGGDRRSCIGKTWPLEPCETCCALDEKLGGSRSFAAVSLGGQI